MSPFARPAPGRIRVDAPGGEAAVGLAGTDPPGPWLHTPLWDCVWMLSALWLVPLVLWLARGHADAARSPVDTLYFAVTVLFWIGHRIGSTWLAYCTTAYRPLLRSSPVRFVVVPGLVAAACFGLILPADGACPGRGRSA